ncbi:MAG: hypothetical protein ACXWT1_03935 [Methylobacter sp.]
MNHQDPSSERAPQSMHVEDRGPKDTILDRGILNEGYHPHKSELDGPQNDLPPPKDRKHLLRMAGAIATIVIAGITINYAGKDHISEAQKQEWASAFATAQPLLLPLVSRQENDSAIVAMPLPPEQKAELKEQVDNGRTRLVWLSFQDVLAEDGDQVRVESGTFSYNVTIMNAVEKVALPEPPSGVINVQGVHDGGGGITIAITSGGVPVNLPYMKVGQTVGVPVIAAQP